MDKSHFKIYDIRQAMADRESVSHLPVVEEHIQIPGYLFPAHRRMILRMIREGYLATAGEYIKELLQASGEWEASEPEDCTQ